MQGGSKEPHIEADTSPASTSAHANTDARNANCGDEQLSTDLSLKLRILRTSHSKVASTSSTAAKAWRSGGPWLSMRRQAATMRPRISGPR